MKASAFFTTRQVPLRCGRAIQYIKKILNIFMISMLHIMPTGSHQAGTQDAYELLNCNLSVFGHDEGSEAIEKSIHVNSVRIRSECPKIEERMK